MSKNEYRRLVKKTKPITESVDDSQLKLLHICSVELPLQPSLYGHHKHIQDTGASKEYQEVYLSEDGQLVMSGDYGFEKVSNDYLNQGIYEWQDEPKSVKLHWLVKEARELGNKRYTFSKEYLKKLADKLFANSPETMTIDSCELSGYNESIRKSNKTLKESADDLDEDEIDVWADDEVVEGPMPNYGEFMMGVLNCFGSSSYYDGLWLASDGTCYNINTMEIENDRRYNAGYSDEKVTNQQVIDYYHDNLVKDGYLDEKPSNGENFYFPINKLSEAYDLVNSNVPGIKESRADYGIGKEEVDYMLEYIIPFTKKYACIGKSHKPVINDLDKSIKESKGTSMKRRKSLTEATKPERKFKKIYDKEFEKYENPSQDILNFIKDSNKVDKYLKLQDELYDLGDVAFKIPDQFVSGKDAVTIGFSQAYWAIYMWLLLYNRDESLIRRHYDEASMLENLPWIDDDDCYENSEDDLNESIKSKHNKN